MKIKGLIIAVLAMAVLILGASLPAMAPVTQDTQDRDYSTAAEMICDDVQNGDTPWQDLLECCGGDWSGCDNNRSQCDACGGCYSPYGHGLCLYCEPEIGTN